MFITNQEGNISLGDRLKEVIPISKELKFLVGFFYFSGFREIYEALKENPEVEIKILVGLQVDKTTAGIITEVAEDNEYVSQEENFNKFLTSLKHALNNPKLDNSDFYEQVNFFLKLLEEDRLKIRKTTSPNHAKLYLFKIRKKDSTLIKNFFITGSSNLTYLGLKEQNEFNVEIKDYGFKEAEKYFDELWEKSDKITEVEDRKKTVIDFIKNSTIASRITPFEAYVFMLRSYLELYEDIYKYDYIEEILKISGFRYYSYQADAVKQALKIIETYNGVIIADVVGLGKSIIASLIARILGKRGIIICPPSLIENWKVYKSKFQLYNWDVESVGKLDTIKDENYEIVIVDEAHRFRNQDTQSYEHLYKLCLGKIVILLTATPFNNTPADIFSLLKLFIVPGASPLTIDYDLEHRFTYYNKLFGKLLKIQKNPEANFELCKKVFRDSVPKSKKEIQKKVNEKIREMSEEIKNILSPVVIRRNRLDLKENPEYSKEIDTFSEVEDPEELFFELTAEQSEFYDEIIKNYFGENGLFTGAIYRPSDYEIITKKANNENEITVTQQQQKNLFNFMRKLLVKRFESSFGAFNQTIERFINIHKKVLDFIDKTGIYILDRKLIDSFEVYDEESDNISENIEKLLQKFQEIGEKTALPKHSIVYLLPSYKGRFKIKSKTSKLNEYFRENIIKDIKLLERIKRRIQELNLVENDPKREMVLKKVKEILNKNENPKRKVIIFSEYADTVKHLRDYFNNNLNNRVLVCYGNISRELYNVLESNFNASCNNCKDDYDVLITTDKLSEGVNLNRAGVIINYDIPWNPTRVIQRLGRINRIGKKVFEKLYIYNIFPTEQGSSEVKIREIAENKMFLIHNALGEDAKIFNPGEQPTPSDLFRKINTNPEKMEEVSFITKIKKEFNDIKEKHPEIIERINTLPKRIKTAKQFEENNVILFLRKGLSIFSRVAKIAPNKKINVEEKNIEEVLKLAKCDIDTVAIPLSKNFWIAYKKLQEFVPDYRKEIHVLEGRTSPRSFEDKARFSLKYLERKISDKELKHFIKTLIKDINEYHTLPTIILRKLILKKGNTNESEVLDYIKKLHRTIGEKYLEKLKKRAIRTKAEVIISMENRKED